MISRIHRFVMLVAFALLLSTSAFPAHAEEFENLSVTAHAMHSGQTFHGYGETQVTIVNHSPTSAHVVTLSGPESSYEWGESIRLITRTVKIAPGAIQTVSFLQPPLLVSGNGTINVAVDGRRMGGVHWPNAGQHLQRGNQKNPVLLVSRTLNVDATDSALNSIGGVPFTAEQATGAPNAHGSVRENCWVPDQRATGRSAWLEVEFAKPQSVKRLDIATASASTVFDGNITLINSKGGNVVLDMGKTESSGGSYRSYSHRFLFDTNHEEIKKVRLEFKSPSGLAIDAVGLSGPGTNQWAVRATASSDDSASLSGTTPHSSPDSIEVLRAESGVSEWGENWLGFTPYDGVALDESDVRQLTSGTRAALTEYLNAGGFIVISGTEALPEWHAWKTTNFSNGEKMEFIGFGQCLLTQKESPASTWEQYRNNLRIRSLYWQSLNSSGDPNQILPVSSPARIPVRSIILLMFIFVIVIGPLNIVYLTRRNRRIWLLWTIPAISLFTTGLIFIYSLLREGITSTVRVAGVTLLDQTAHRATSSGVSGFYCPLIPSSGLTFNFGTEVTPMLPDDSGSSTDREVDWTQTQHFTTGWLPARVPTYFYMNRSEIRRERLQMEFRNGQWFAANNLGAPISRLWFMDEQGHLFTGSAIAPSASVALVKTAVGPISVEPGPNAFLKDRGAFGVAPTAQTDLALLPNSYVAELAANPFLETPLRSSDLKKTQTSGLVYGLLDASDVK